MGVAELEEHVIVWAQKRWNVAPWSVERDVIQMKCQRETSPRGSVSYPGESEET